MTSAKHFGLLVTAYLSLLLIAPNTLGAQRTFVKSDGLDTNACSLPAPCRSFAAAIANTLPGGEVIVLDSAGYGPVTINQSLSIIAPRGVYAGISSPSGAGVTVDGAGIVVALEGLTIYGGISPFTGIVFSQGAELHVNNCSIAFVNGLSIEATAPSSRLFVRDTVVRRPSAAMVLNGTITAVFDRVRFEHTWGGVVARDGASVAIRESMSAGSTLPVVASASMGSTTRVVVEDSTFSDTTYAGLSLEAVDSGSIATLDIIRSTITRNGVPPFSLPTNGIVVSATAPASSLLTVSGSVISENTAFGVSLSGNAVGLVNDNHIARNVSGGIGAGSGAVAHTRSNNTGQQPTPVSGNVIPVAGF